MEDGRVQFGTRPQPAAVQVFRHQGTAVAAGRFKNFIVGLKWCIKKEILIQIHITMRVMTFVNNYSRTETSYSNAR